MAYIRTTRAPGTCPICSKLRPGNELITCAHCWNHVLNGKDRQELATLYRRHAPTAAKCAKIRKRIEQKILAAAPLRCASILIAQP